MRGFNSLLTKFFDRNEMEIILRDNPSKISALLAKKIQMENYIPPLSELFYIIFLSSFMKPQSRESFLDEAIKRYGLLSRVWTPSLSLLEVKKRTQQKLSAIEPSRGLINIYLYLLDRYTSEPNRDTLIDLAALIDFYLRNDECYPSRNLPAILESLDNISKPEQLIQNIKNRLRAGLPSVIFDSIDKYTRLLFKTPFEKLNLEHIEKIFGKNPYHLHIYLLLLTVSAIAIELKEMLNRSTILTKFIHIILDSLPNYEFSPYLLFSAIFSLRHLRRYDLAIILNSYLLTTIHKDGNILNLILETKYQNIKQDLTKLIMLIQLLVSPQINQLLLYFSRISKFSLRELNSILLESNIKPHGIILGIPWELLGSQDYLLKVTSNALNMYRKFNVKPPIRLKLLKKFLESLNKIKRKPPVSSIEEQIAYLATLFETQAYGNAFLTLTRRFYGVIPGFYRIINELTRTFAKAARKWEYTLLTLYGSLLNQNKNLFTYTSLTHVDPSKKNLILVIDGLRYDDFVTKLSSKLNEIGFKTVQLTPKISLLPSITSISRYSIISGRPPEVFNISRVKPREDTVLESRFGNIDIFYGPIQLVEHNISKKTQLSNNVAIVLSELEKSMHGASETILAHFISEYIDNILELISYTATRMKTKNNEKITLTICSDHGLGIFHKVYELDEFIEQLQSRRLLETSLDPIIRERYAILPAKNPQTILTIKKIYNSDDEFRTNFWLITGDNLNYKFIEFYRHATRALTDLKPANETIILFPKGHKKFLKTRGSIFHGGPSPDEMFSAFGVFEIGGK